MLPSFKEDHISQIPALQFLQKAGYHYLTPGEADNHRGNKLSGVILEDILEEQLHRLNGFEFGGQSYKFSNVNIHNAIRELKDFSLKDGLIRTNEQVYDLITLGKSFEENIKGDRKSFNIQYIDWKNPSNNVFHVTEEFSVQRSGSFQSYRPDIVLFINGIPFVLIECKRPDLITSDKKKPVEQAISQHIRNQEADGIPYLYIYSQLLLAVCSNDARYATTGSKPEFWFYWKEQNSMEEEIDKLINKSLPDEQKDKLFSTRFKYVRDYFKSKEQSEVEITQQDKLLYSLCKPARLLELVYKFIVYDAGIKKIARYQQYFAVKNTIDRVKYTDRGKRRGGVIWHTQGSGKSLTMVWLAKALALEHAILNPGIVLVTDRIDLDDQIYKTFKNCDKEVVQAKTGKHLVELINSGKDNIITTLINKFEAAVKQGKTKSESSEIFVLVDESHRSQYGSANIKMQQVFPNACYIGFTGTPLMKKDKNTAYKFGGFIDKYTIDLAVKDKAVVPLLYEGRHVVQTVSKDPVDTYFNMISEPLTEYQRTDLKKKFSNADHLNEANQKIYRICWDISLYFRNTWQGTGFKGQLTTPSKKASMLFKKYMDEIGILKTEVLISGPDDREGHEDFYEGTDDTVQRFWKKMMERFGSEKQYNKSLINSFKNVEEPEIIIVVDKLLTGFDAPKNVVLFLTRSLKEHGLLQAIARVNRVYEGKDFGYIIDYYGILGKLDEALSSYSSLSEFDEDDLEGTLINIREEIKTLSEKHSYLWDLFRSIENKKDEEAFEQFLADKAIRDKFYERLSAYVRTLKIAMSSFEFIEKTLERTVEKYRNDAKFFLQLRVSVKARYSDAIDYKQYETQVQKLIDTHITSDKIIKLTDQVNIFEKEKFEEEVEKVIGKAAKADMIASRTAKTITDRMEEDPAFYKKFSRLLEETIEEYRQRRIDEIEYLEQVKQIMNSVQNRTGDETPEQLKDNEVAKAFYGIVNEMLDIKIPDEGKRKGFSAETGLIIDEIIIQNKVVDWQEKEDVINRMKQNIEDYLYETMSKEELELDWDIIDNIIEKSIDIAKRRY